VSNSGDEPGRKRRANVGLLLEDMRESAAAIERYIKDTTASDFSLDVMRQDAVVRRLEIIGEAAGRIMKAEPQFESSLSDIPLRDAYDLRNFVSHGYDAIDVQIV
jgi:uncharacterized protein with HEPN domain